jgi:hypothetical protein
MRIGLFRALVVWPACCHDFVCSSRYRFAQWNRTCSNRTVFGVFNVNLSDPNFGRVTGAQSGPRIIQLRMRLNFCIDP